MIRDEAEYRRALTLLREEGERIAQYPAKWAAHGYTPEQVAKLREPLESFHLQLVEEVESYERLKRGQR